MIVIIDGDGEDNYSSCHTHCGHNSMALLLLIILPASQTQKTPASKSGPESLKEQSESHQHHKAPQEYMNCADLQAYPKT